MINLNNARKIFLSFAEKWNENENKDKKNEFITAREILYATYDGAVNENKFIVGGSIEVFFVALLRAFGFKVDIVSGKSFGYDILWNGIEFSIKSRAYHTGVIRILNIHGKAETKREWEHPTLAIIGGLGIGYFDPLLKTKNSCSLKNLLKKSGADGFDLSMKNLKNLWKTKTQFLFDASISTKEEAEKHYIDMVKKIASYEISSKILKEECPILSKCL